MSSADPDVDVVALAQVLLELRANRLEASRIVVGRITLDLLPRSQLEESSDRSETRIPLDASGGRMRS